MNVESLQFLQTSLTRIDPLIRDAVTRAQEAGNDPTDSLRGLIISDDEVEAHLSKPVLAGLWTAHDTEMTLPITFEGNPDLPFLHLIKIFKLNTIDAHILLLALAAELDRRYERLYAYLQDDVSQRRPTVNLVMNILGTTVPQRFAVWSRLHDENPLRKFFLVECLPDKAQQHASFLAYQCKVDHRIVSHLLGDDTPDSRIRQAVMYINPSDYEIVPPLVTEAVRDAFKQSPMLYFKGELHNGQIEAAAALCRAYNMKLLKVDMKLLAQEGADFELAWKLALREANLTDCAIMLENWDACLDEENEQPPVELWEALTNYDLPIFLCSTEEWESLDIQRKRRLLRLAFEKPEFNERRTVWEIVARRNELKVPDSELGQIANKFRFNRVQIERTLQTASDLALTRGADINLEDLYAGAQAHANLRLKQYAKKIEPRYDWGDLILPPEALEQLQEIEQRARWVHVVHQDWGYGKKVDPVPGISALFAGESGTGKTLAAEVIANSLGLVMYKIDLAQVVSKYIGETEKNLSSIFAEARTHNAVLFFDEADAIFGKRSEVKDARDRYANIEIAYLLQEIESYSGIAIMATNLRQNIDEAFTRRIDFLIDFPFPETEYRQRIWEIHFPEKVPMADDVNLPEIADYYELAGGNIRNAAVAAAYYAAADGGKITRAHIALAIRREHQKMGRLLQD
jgi:SpoVK/Ycf46/Vps4 family AAA+-type ATPase